MLFKHRTSFISSCSSCVNIFLNLGGGELFQHLSNAKKFPEKQARFYCMQIALGLGHLHSKNFLYRDLKL
jgi:serine/threonine protein kinase